MSRFALVGSVTFVLSEKKTYRKFIFRWLLFRRVVCRAGLFFSIEQFLHRHQCRRAASDCKKPLIFNRNESS